MKYFIKNLVTITLLSSLVNVQSVVPYAGSYTSNNVVIDHAQPFQDYIPMPYARWFEDVSRIFYRGSDAVAYDIGTGKSFNIRRTFGTNHADIEPLTAADAAIMYDIWGGHSWARRPVLVFANGYIFPGSLTNFPHAGRDDAPAYAVVDNRSGGFGRGINFNGVQGNGVDGHMCLHFAGSLLHGSNRSNQDHQNAVIAAREHLMSTKHVSSTNN